MNVEGLILSDRLAVENILMANERTLLSFFKTGIFFLATGISILSIHFLYEIPYWEWSFTILSPIILLIGGKKHNDQIINKYSV